MRFLGFLLLLAGWFLVIASIVLMSTAGSRAAFIVAGMAVETLGLVFVIKSHSIPREEKR